MDRSRQTQHPRVAATDSQPTADGRAQVPNLSRERIIRSAISLLDAEGLAGLSMRRLADNLDAGAMSLYWYFSTKDELLRATTDAVLGEIRLRNLPDDWRATVRTIATDLRAVIQRHPWLRHMLSSVPAIGPHGLAVMETILATLARAGLSGHSLDVALSTILGYVQGFAVGENLWTQSFREAAPALPVSPEVAAAHPRFTAFVTAAAAVDPDLRFTTGLNIILAGIEATASD